MALLTDVLTLTVYVQNNGNESACSSRIVFTFPEWIVKSGSTVDSSCTPTATSLSCTLAQVEPGMEVGLW